jgi:hypothetical protein
VRAVHKLLSVLTIGGGGGVPGQGVGVEGIKRGNIAPKPPEIKKNGWFPRLIDLKIVENAIFTLNHLIIWIYKM